MVCRTRRYRGSYKYWQSSINMRSPIVYSFFLLYYSTHKLIPTLSGKSTTYYKNHPVTMSATPQDQHPPSRVVERYIAIPGPKNYLRSKQQAAFFGVIMVAYLTIATLIPQDCVQLSDYHSFAIEKEEDWEDIQDEEAPLTPVQSWGEYTRVRLHLFSRRITSLFSL